MEPGFLSAFRRPTFTSQSWLFYWSYYTVLKQAKKSSLLILYILRPILPVKLYYEINCSAEVYIATVHIK